MSDFDRSIWATRDGEREELDPGVPNPYIGEYWEMSEFELTMNHARLRNSLPSLERELRLEAISIVQKDNGQQVGWANEAKDR